MKYNNGEFQNQIAITVFACNELRGCNGPSRVYRGLSDAPPVRPDAKLALYEGVELISRSMLLAPGCSCLPSLPRPPKSKINQNQVYLVTHT